MYILAKNVALHNYNTQCVRYNSIMKFRVMGKVPGRKEMRLFD